MAHLVEEDVKDAADEREWQRCGEQGEEPAARVHRCVERMSCKVAMQVGQQLLQDVVQLEHAQAEVVHVGLVDLSQIVLLHDLDEDGEPKSREFRPGVDKPQDEAEEMEESEWKDNQEQKRKEAMLEELTAPALSAEERDPDRFYKQSLILTKQKKYKEALEAINKALKLKPLFWEAQIQGAIVLSLQGRDQEAIEKYKYIVNLRPDLLDAAINLGSLLGKTGDYAGAEQQYKNVIHRNFYLVSAHFNLANLYIKQGKFDHAIAELKTCIKMKPNHAWAHNNLGVIFQKRKFIEEAQEEFLKALSLQPSNKTFESNLNMMRELLKKKAVKA